MITGGIETPERAFDSQERVGERKILRRSSKRKPDLPQTVGRDEQMIVRDVAIVIPNETTMPGGPIDRERENSQREREQKDF